MLDGVISHGEIIHPVTLRRFDNNQIWSEWYAINQTKYLWWHIGLGVLDTFRSTPFYYKCADINKSKMIIRMYYESTERTPIKWGTIYNDGAWWKPQSSTNCKIKNYGWK